MPKGKALTHRERMDRAMSEAQVQRVVTDALDTFGWIWHHETDSRKSKRGFPDICAVHPHTGALLFLELKRETGRVSPEQERWLAALSQHGPICRPGFVPLQDSWHGYKALIVRPSNLDDAITYIRAFSQ